MDAYTRDMYSILHFIVMMCRRTGTSLEPSKSIGAFTDVPDLATSGKRRMCSFILNRSIRTISIASLKAMNT